jgi:hypothetical protein
MRAYCPPNGVTDAVPDVALYRVDAMPIHASMLPCELAPSDSVIACGKLLKRDPPRNTSIPCKAGCRESAAGMGSMLSTTRMSGVPFEDP